MKGTKKKMKFIKVNDFLVEFVRYYKLMPALWNPKCEDYNNRTERSKCYYLLLQKYRECDPDATLSDVRDRVNALRSNYRRYLRRLENRGCTSEAESHPFWKELHFIVDNDEVKSEIDVEASFSELKSDPSNQIQKVQLSDDEQDESENSDIEYLESETDATPPNTHKRRKTEPTPSLIYEDDSHDEDLDDEYYCWGKVMVAELKKMSPLQQIYAKKAITEVLMEGQLGLLHKDSVQINKTLEKQYERINVSPEKVSTPADSCSKTRAVTISTPKGLNQTNETTVDKRKRTLRKLYVPI